MQLAYQQFYRMYGVRRATHLLAPRLNIIRTLPKDSVVHYLSEDPAIPEIDIWNLNSWKL